MSEKSKALKVGSDYIISHSIDNWSHTSNYKQKINFIHRSNIPVMCVDVKQDKCVILQESIAAKIENKKISFSRPNEIALSMHIANSSLKKSQELRKSIIKRIEEDKNKKFFENDVIEIYDYLEEVQKAVVFSYKAIEAMCNSAMPDDYVYDKSSNKIGVIEVYDKLGIERWVSTTEKVSKILPDIYNCVSPVQKPFWGHFKKLEELRNEIIHSKSSSSSKVLSELLSADISKYVKSCEALLKFFFEQDRRNHLFPLIPGVTEIESNEMEDMEEYFKNK
ncbi:TPA: hypothetical protein SMF84_001489 [Serratia marcescens]|nr:hypothetical protein [Serratia marcescens]HEJ7182538.1 hypothetical protein [Serratia marcescens]HEJ7211863.1 hypothetical protein [Serratia marcescens]